MKNCSLEYRTVFESHSQLKLKSGATYCINPELKPRTCPIFPALLGCGDSSVPWQLQNKVKQKTFPLTSNYREQEHVFFFLRSSNEETVNVFGVWWTEQTQMSKHRLHPAKNVTSTCYWNRLQVSARQATLASTSRTTAAVKTFSNTCQEHMKPSVYRVWMVAGRLWAACLFCHPGTSRQTDSGPRRSQTDRQCCGIYL